MPASISITTTATLLVPAKGQSIRAWLSMVVPAGGQVVYIGRSAAVTQATGLILRPSNTVDCHLFASGVPAGEAWYGIVASGTQLVRVEEGGGAGASRGNDSLLTITRPVAQEAAAGGGLPNGMSVEFNDDDTGVVWSRNGEPVGQQPLYEIQT